MQVCLPAGCIDAIRVALVDECTDLPIPGATSGYVFNCFRNLELTTNIEDGEETILRNDCGKKCFATRQCDELTNVGVSFELLNPDYELTNLLTGQALINDGVENIGWYQAEGLNCSPWLSVEMFERVPDEQCAPGHRYRRIVLPKVRFKIVPSNTREGVLRVLGIEGLSSPASISAWGTGPFYDSPFDFGDLASDIQTHIMEFFDSSLTDTIEGTCGFIPVQTQNLFSAFWSAQDEMTVSDNEGANTFCDADTITITLPSGTITIPLPNPSVTVVDCDTITITDWAGWNPANEPIIEIAAWEAGDNLGAYDGNLGLPPGEYAVIEPTPAFIETLFPGIDTSNGHILMGGDTGPGCWYLSMWYDCTTDEMALAFNKKDLYDGTVVRTEIESDTGIADATVVNEWVTPASAWTYGSGMTIQNASALGLDWNTIRVYDNTDALVCMWTDPVQTWNGGPWLIDPTQCSDYVAPPGGGGPPIINNVVVTP